jgi:hypothetical protein
MATTTNYGWDTPDDTDLVKDGAAAIRTLGSSVDTTTKALNPSTTLGDIEYRSATANTNTRLGVGTTGQVLTVAGGVPSWATPGGAGASWSLVNAGGTALTGAQTITVSGISGADKIMILVNSASTASASDAVRIRLNTDTGLNYFNVGPLITAGASYSTSIVARENGGNSRIEFFTMSSNAGSEGAGFCLITGCNSSGLKMFNSAGSANTSGGNGQAATVMGGYYDSASTISSVSLNSALGNFDAGTVFVYTSA